MSLLEKLKSAGPKRILSLDGGGIRGALTLGYLERIEQILRQQKSAERQVLDNHFPNVFDIEKL